jgi:hypothetical protein
MMYKNTTFTTIFRVKKCHFHYDTYEKKKNYVIYTIKMTMFHWCFELNLI